MCKLFIFTAADPAAQKNLERSIKRPISSDVVYETFDKTRHDRLKEIENEVQGFYAWGAVPSDRNQATWARMQPGDFVFCVFDSTYQYVARIMVPFRNPRFASKIWGNLPDGKTWEMMYFLTQPASIEERLADWTEIRRGQFMGFTAISDARLAEIESKHDNIEAFVKNMIGEKAYKAIAGPF